MIVLGRVRTCRQAAKRGSRVCAEPPARSPAVETAVAGETVTVVLSGEFDVASAGLLSGQLERIRAGNPGRLVFETARVAFMDCGSARLMTGAGRWLPAGVRPVIRHPSPIVRRVLEVSGIDALCQLEP